MVKLAVYSDLHTEFHKGYKLPVPDEADIVILAGDIVVGDPKWILALCNQHQDKQFIYVAGNHDHYGQELYDSILTYKEAAETVRNLWFLENESVFLHGIWFHGCTLWTDFTSQGEAWTDIGKLESKRNIADFHSIRVDGERITPDQMAQIHKDSVAWLAESLYDHRHEVNVVVTHFPPILECKHPKIPAGILDCYFNNDLEGLVEEFPIDLWISGHTHYNHSFKLHGTNFVSNQLGYPREYTEYKSDLLLEVN